METPTTQDDGKIVCMVCKGRFHAIEVHLKKDHPEYTIEQYQEEFPGQPVLSELAKKILAERRAKEAAGKKKDIVSSSVKKALHEIFGLKKIKAAMNSRGEPIPVNVLSSCEDPEMIPDVDSNYVYDLEALKNCLLAIELNKPLYVWGHAGTGKTTLIEQICAHTGRPMLRVQHSANTEESHILGQWTAVNGHTKFELGPLALAMKRGWVYLADEYDFAMPSVLAVYQPILEGKSLVIKEADEANRVIRPHPNFRFIATGNTNGSGDETGLYQGTTIQNAANYDRFAMVIQMYYPKPEIESRILMNQTSITQEDANKIVDFAKRVRESYEGNKISNTISPRTLINIATIGRHRGSYQAGITMSFANKLTKVDKVVVEELAQRIFG